MLLASGRCGSLLVSRQMSETPKANTDEGPNRAPSMRQRAWKPVARRWSLIILIVLAVGFFAINYCVKVNAAILSIPVAVAFFALTEKGRRQFIGLIVAATIVGVAVSVMEGSYKFYFSENLQKREACLIIPLYSAVEAVRSIWSR